MTVHLNRRTFLRQTGVGAAALTSLMTGEAVAGLGPEGQSKTCRKAVL